MRTLSVSQLKQVMHLHTHRQLLALVAQLEA